MNMRMLFMMAIMMVVQIQGSSSSSSSFVAQPFELISNFKTNFIINGDFQIPQLPSNTNFTFENFILGWSGNKEMEIGKGNTYNPLWSSQITDLFAKENVKITQTVNLPFGINSQQCVLRYQYAPYSQFSTPANRSQMKVYWNNVQIKSIVASNYNIVTDEVIVDCHAGRNVLSFQGTIQTPGPANGMGLDNVQLFPIYKLFTKDGKHYTERQSSSSS